MKEETSEERHVERDSQLSAMFDGELSAAECELIARRLARDEALRSQWSRYAMVGAALRAERGVALHERVAFRVQAAIAQEVTYGEDVAATSTRTAAVVPGEVLRRAGTRRWSALAKPMFGAGIAASVAAASILMLRGQGDTEQPALLAAAPASENVVLASEAAPAPAAGTLASAAARRPSSGEPERYITPPSGQAGIASPARLANYVVAHSEYSGPLSRRMALLGLVGAEAANEDASTPADAEDSSAVAAGAPDGP